MTCNRIHSHRLPDPVPIEDPLPEPHPSPDEEPVPDHNPEGNIPRSTPAARESHVARIA